ncbi:MAG TPA: carboxy-S-adenosyl-L-methionine synthase CmoA [Candidatus Sulfotelmatobacter sp.]|nr:carboxy-S-adenosyl-L-methionine synthase CmoA [Candidatus Sulfotelmatobacter sp.]
MSGRDRYFRNATKMSGFTFNRNVASVFDDMVVRSIPFYLELQRMVGELGAVFHQPGTCVYDLGCSTGTTLLSLMRCIQDPRARFIGLDGSPPMRERARGKIGRCRARRNVTFIAGDLNKPDFPLHRASVITINWTLQFVRPTRRGALLKKIWRALVDGGALILCEKILGEPEELNRLYMDLYYDFKRRSGYSELEIARKREALENVLVPCTLAENIDLLRGAGFRRVDPFFRWYNWAGLLAVKQRRRG